MYTWYTAYGADSSIIETMSVKFNTTYGDPEEIPQPQITINGSGVSIGDIYYKTEYENWKPGKKVRMEITVDAAQEMCIRDSRPGAAKRPEQFPDPESF